MRYDYPVMAGPTCTTAPRMDHRGQGQPQSSIDTRPPHHTTTASTATSPSNSSFHHHHHHNFLQHRQSLNQALDYQLAHHSQHNHYLHNQIHGFRHRPHALITIAPPTSQLRLSPLLTIQQQQQQQQQRDRRQQRQGIHNRQSKQQPQMPLFIPISLSGAAKHFGASSSSGVGSNPRAARSRPQQLAKSATTNAKARSKPVLGPVDAEDLSRRLHAVLAQQELAAAERAMSLTSATSAPTVLAQPVVNHATDRPRPIRSRGSDNLRAAYVEAAHATAAHRGAGSSSKTIQRKPFSAPNLGSLAMSLASPALPERRRHRARSSSPRLRLQRGGMPLGAAAEKNEPFIPTKTPPAQQAAPYIPNQAAKQFERTTAAKGAAMTRKTSSSKMGQQHQHHKSLPISLQQQKIQQQKSAMSMLAEPTAKLDSNHEVVGEDKTPVAARTAKAPKAVAALDFFRIVQEHTVDWTQKDEELTQKKLKEGEKNGKKGLKVKEKKRLGDDGPLWRLKKRLSSLSMDHRSSLPTAQDGKAPTVAVVSLAEHIVHDGSVDVRMETVAPLSDATALHSSREMSAADAAKLAATSQTTPSSSAALSHTSTTAAGHRTMSSKKSFLSLFKR